MPNLTWRRQQVVRSWLIKAQRDLASARTLASAKELLLDTAIYHCQQAGEKAVKAFLVNVLREIPSGDRIPMATHPAAPIQALILFAPGPFFSS